MPDGMARGLPRHQQRPAAHPTNHQRHDNQQQYDNRQQHNDRQQHDDRQGVRPPPPGQPGLSCILPNCEAPPHQLILPAYSLINK